MAERMNAEIEIGGAVPARLVEKLIGAIKAEGVGLWDESSFEATTAEDLLALATDENRPGTLRLMDHELAWGQFETLEAFLVKHRIAFDRWTEAKYEYDGQLAQFRRGMTQPAVYLATQAKEPVVLLRLLAPVQEALVRRQIDRAQSLLRRALGRNIPPLEPLQIINERQRRSARRARKRRELST